MDLLFKHSVGVRYTMYKLKSVQKVCPKGLSKKSVQNFFVWRGGCACRYVDTFRYVNTLTLGTIYNTARTYY